MNGKIFLLNRKPDPKKSPTSFDKNAKNVKKEEILALSLNFYIGRTKNKTDKLYQVGITYKIINTQKMKSKHKKKIKKILLWAFVIVIILAMVGITFAPAFMR